MAATVRVAHSKSSPSTANGAQARAAAKVDWNRITSNLGLRGGTANALAAFKKRNDDARRRVQQLSEQPQMVDFQHYRDVLNNKTAVDEVERQMKGYKMQSYDVQRQIKGIETFEVSTRVFTVSITDRTRNRDTVKNAEETSKLVESELKDLATTLKNIESARPFDELTVDEVMEAQPEIEKKVEHMVKNHRWMPAGYKEKFGDLSVL
ncbi:MAG: hypothetical protein Q9159_004814 [Coniocarpon cinnabarinum]